MTMIVVALRNVAESERPFKRPQMLFYIITLIWPAITRSGPSSRIAKA